MRGDDRISAFLDGELDELSAARFSRELATDPALRAEVERLRRQRDLLLRLGAPVAAPPGFADRVQAAVDVELPDRDGLDWATLWRPALLVASAVLVLWRTLPATPVVDPAAPRTVSAEGTFDVVQLPEAYDLTGTTVSRDVLVDAVRAAGGTVETLGPTLTVTAPHASWPAITAALEVHGVLTGTGVVAPRVGPVRATITLRP